MDTKRKVGESYKEYCERIYRNKPLLGHNNDVLGYIINENCPPEEQKGESAHRKGAAERIEAFDRGYQRALTDLSNSSQEELEGKGLSALIPKSHLENIKDMLGEYTIKKYDSQLQRNSLAKLMRDATLPVLFAEGYREALKEVLGDLAEDFLFNKSVLGEDCAVIKGIPADWHVGVKVDEEYNYHDHEKAIRKVDAYANKLMEYADLYKTKYISITHLGDIIENFDMRVNQPWECEFDTKQQMSRAQQLLWRLVKVIMKNGYYVELSAVYGNHDRYTGNKHQSIENDTVIYTIMENLKELVLELEEFSGKRIENLKILTTVEDYEYHVDEFYGSKIRYQHGHNDAKNDEKKIEKYNGVDGEKYDILVFGHLHHGRVISRNRNEKEIYAGTLMGANFYGKSKIKSVADASQGIIVFRDNGDIIPFEVNLQDI